MLVLAIALAPSTGLVLYSETSTPSERLRAPVATLTAEQEREIRTLAAQFTKGSDGEPRVLLEGAKDEYYVVYKTPRQELRQLGDRVVLVNLKQETVEHAGATD